MWFALKVARFGQYLTVNPCLFTSRVSTRRASGIHVIIVRINDLPLSGREISLTPFNKQEHGKIPLRHERHRIINIVHRPYNQPLEIFKWKEIMARPATHLAPLFLIPSCLQHSAAVSTTFNSSAHTCGPQGRPQNLSTAILNLYSISAALLIFILNFIKCAHHSETTLAWQRGVTIGLFRRCIQKLGSGILVIDPLICDALIYPELAWYGTCMCIAGKRTPFA